MNQHLTDSEDGGRSERSRRLIVARGAALASAGTQSPLPRGVLPGALILWFSTPAVSPLPLLLLTGTANKHVLSTYCIPDARLEVPGQGRSRRPDTRPDIRELLVSGAGEERLPTRKACLLAAVDCDEARGEESWLSKLAGVFPASPVFLHTTSFHVTWETPTPLSW